MISDLEFGTRVARFRKRKALTQADLARAIGIARTTLVAIENGQRTATPEEIVTLADKLGATLHELLDPYAVVTVEAPRFRSSFGRGIDDSLIRTAVDQVVALAQNVARLERLRGARSQPGILASLATYRGIGRSSKDEARRAGEDAAARVRDLLVLGDEPVREFAARLELEGGFRVFGRKDLPATISGFFLWGPEIGPCIAVNRHHPAERQLWTLAHETGHFLDDREAGDAFPDSSEKLHWTPAEVFAETFARDLLLPARSVRRHFVERRRLNGRFTVHDMVMLAAFFGVSFEAVARRLEELELTRRGTLEQLGAQRFRATEARRVLGVPDSPGLPEFPNSYVTAAFEAFNGEKISEGELAELLQTDRLDVRMRFREWAQERATIGDINPIDELR